MNRRDTLDERVVEIRVPLSEGKERVGSGYVISPGRVITALHVVVGGRAETVGNGSATGAIRVRALGDLFDRVGDTRHVDLSEAVRQYELRAAGDFLWRGATIAWPLNASEKLHLEFAVLDVSKHSDCRVLATSPAVRAGTLDDDVECRAIGFPSWSSSRLPDGSKVLDTAVIRARFKKSVSIFNSMHDIYVISGAPAEQERWRGLSGAALFCTKTQTLGGIISMAKDAAGNDVLAATVLSDAAASAEFDAFWLTAGLKRPTLQSDRSNGSLALPPVDAEEDALVEFIRQFPPGPPLPSDILPPSIRSNLHLIKGAAAESVIQDANRLRRAVSPDIPDRAMLLAGLPEIDMVGPERFWLRAVGDATLKGPQTTAALIISLPRHLFHGQEKSVHELLCTLLYPPKT
jgi:hypothetical protein